MCILAFTVIKKHNGKFCFHFFAVGSNTTLKNHISHPHCEVLKAQQNQNPEAGQTTMGRDGQVFMYNPDYLREQFAGLVIQRGLPFNHFDNEQTTRVFQNTMQPRYTHVPIVNQMKEAFKQMLKDVFKSGEKNRRRYIKICHDAEKPCYSPNWDIETRWNSTFEMFESGLKQQITLSHFHDILVSKNGRRFKKFPDEYWGLIEMLNPLLAVFQNATVVLSGVYYPTSPLVLQQIFFISCKLSDLELEGGVLSSMVKPMKRKLRKYFENMPPIITCAAALNPCFNVSGVDYLIENISRDLEFADDGFATSSNNKLLRVSSSKRVAIPLFSYGFCERTSATRTRILMMFGVLETKENLFSCSIRWPGYIKCPKLLL
ncbi:zinc finger BED domain-containing protein RICESLEEPER 2-like protein [Tanacetum coccineum]